MIRFGIVGAGGIARKFARDISLVDNAILTAVSARDEETAQKYKEEYNVKYAYNSYERLSKSDRIDAVYIATPHNFHHDQAIMFMKQGKHVLIEKSVSVNEKELLEMIKVAKENKVLLMEAMWTHFLPSSAFAKEKVKELGSLKEAYLDFGFDLIGNNPKARILKPELAGGSILDIGVYPISFYHFLQNAPIKTIEASANFLDTGVDSECNILITDELDAKIHIKSSIKELLPHTARFVYEKGTIEMRQFSRCTELYINGERFDIEYIGEGFPHQIESFASTIENEKLENHIMTYEASLKCMRTMDKVRELINLKYPFE